MYYKCRYFRIEELVPKNLHTQFGEDCWQFFNPLALEALDNVRIYFDRPVTVNTWLWGGNLQLRGLRPPGTSVGAAYSLHKFGGAFDFDVWEMLAGEVRQVILDNQDQPAFENINCLEADVSWVHMDVRNVEDRIKLVYPR